MLADSLRFPFQGDGWVRPFLIGSLCALGSFLVLPAIILFGYTLRTIRAGATDQEGLPAFDDWKSLLVDGIRAYAVVLAFTIVTFALVLLVLTGVVSVGAVSTGGAGSGPTPTAVVPGVASAVAILGFLLATLVTLAVTYLIPASLVGLATQDDFTAAFDLGAIRSLVTSRAYLVGMVVVTGVAIVGSLVADPLVFLVVGFAVQFYVQIVMGHYLGQIARKAADDRQRAGAGVATNDPAV